MDALATPLSDASLNENKLTYNIWKQFLSLYLLQARAHKGKRDRSKHLWVIYLCGLHFSATLLLQCRRSRRCSFALPFLYTRRRDWPLLEQTSTQHSLYRVRMPYSSPTQLHTRIHSISQGYFYLEGTLDLLLFEKIKPLSCGLFWIWK